MEDEDDEDALVSSEEAWPPELDAAPPPEDEEPPTAPLLLLELVLTLVPMQEPSAQMLPRPQSAWVKHSSPGLGRTHWPLSSQRRPALQSESSAQSAPSSMQMPLSLQDWELSQSRSVRQVLAQPPAVHAVPSSQSSSDQQMLPSSQSPSQSSISAWHAAAAKGMTATAASRKERKEEEREARFCVIVETHVHPSPGRHHCGRHAMRQNLRPDAEKAHAGGPLVDRASRFGGGL